MSSSPQKFQADMLSQPATLLAAARAMQSKLHSRKPGDEVTCQLSPETIADFVRYGFFKVLRPARFGGLEMPAPVLFEIEIALAEADMSAAWVMSNMNVAAFHAALFSPQAQAELWQTNEEALIASSNMPGGRLTRSPGGGYRLSGFWRFSSGAAYADWFVLGAFAENEGEQVAGGCLVPRKDVTVLPDWDVVGLRGTGSNAIRVEEVEVPGHRFLPHIDRFHGTAPGLEINTGPLFRLPLPQLLFRSISSASIGGLKGMLDLFLERNRDRTSMMAQRIAEDPHVRALCGTVDADLQALHGGMEHDLATLANTGNPGNADDLAFRRRARLNTTRITENCFQQAAALYRAAGAAALYSGSSFLMFFNDLLAARQHAANQFEIHARNDGAQLFGQDREDILL
ncbi:MULTISPECIES: hypothetical protein [unclassified Roseibium]|uniref:hypothetical protein n=1 Tax=unclassified Roseibium TaxID=2629323 RepID=UPI00317604E8